MRDIQQIIDSRKYLPVIDQGNKVADEGGCGVVGFASSEQLAGKYLLTALDQMKNRGNGKGGGVAIVGLKAEELRVTEQILSEDYILQIAYLDEQIREELEDEFIRPLFVVDHEQCVPTIDDHKKLGLEVKPPVVYQYFVRIQEDILRGFMEEFGFTNAQKAEDEFVYQNSYRLNTRYYASLGDKQAFVLSHAKNLLVFKIVGYADQVIRYYKLNEICGHIWVGHHRYPTKGTIWHPGGAHPFIGLNEALVHNGDFSNYHAVSEYLAQRNIYPQFLTDTEVAALQFDLYSRIYEYPTEYLIEAIAPTTERDFTMLSAERQEIYRQIQLSHLHGSPDGPWFFIIGRSQPSKHQIELLGITDTSMLRPQVFALYEQNGVGIGLIGSERQAIDATLRSLAKDDTRFASRADMYWNARGGSYTDGGAFIFRIGLDDKKLVCEDKFGTLITTPVLREVDFMDELDKLLDGKTILANSSDLQSFNHYAQKMRSAILQNLISRSDAVKEITQILDSWHLLNNSKDGINRSIIENLIADIFQSFPPITKNEAEGVLIDYHTRRHLRAPQASEEFLVLDVSAFPVEGDDSAAKLIVDAYHLGWSHIYSFNWRGHRFCGVGLGPDSQGFRIDTYGNPGDYLASGLDGAEIYVHGSAQDQVGQMMKSGRLVIYGDVGQTFLYGAKGGEVYVLGNAAGRPLINAVGNPKVIINGTCLDYLAESFMAGDPLDKGGFAILYGLRFHTGGDYEILDTPYPGSNIFSLASGGAIYAYDPHARIEDNQLNGGQIVKLSSADWDLISPYMAINAKLFSYNLQTAMKTNGNTLLKDFIKIQPVNLRELSSH